MKFYVDYFGCRTNQAEIQECILGLENSGYKLTTNITNADFGILNTCCVTERAEKDVLRFLNKVYKRTNIKWIITGCLVSKENQTLKKKYKNYFFINNKKKENLLNITKDIFPTKNNIIFHSSFRSRIFLKIHDGCNFRCSFCIVPFLRGKSKSIPSTEVIKKAEYYSSLGYREIVLTGINLSSFGYDLFPRENLLELIKKINVLKNIDSIRLSSLDPRFIRYKFIKELSYLEKIANSFHFSFQSGSNSVLRRMKRGSKTIEYNKILDNFFHFFPNANYGADIMVGFPNECEKEYKETLNFIKQSELNYIHIFPFSPRKGTKAELMEQIPTNIKKKRVKELKEINKNIRMEYKERFINKILEGILIEENQNYALLITKNFLSVRIPPVKGYKKRTVRVKINRIVNENLCEGNIVKK